MGQSYKDINWSSKQGTFSGIFCVSDFIKIPNLVNRLIGSSMADTNSTLDGLVKGLAYVVKMLANVVIVLANLFVIISQVLRLHFCIFSYGRRKQRRQSLWWRSSLGTSVFWLLPRGQHHAASIPRD